MCPYNHCSRNEVLQEKLVETCIHCKTYTYIVMLHTTSFSCTIPRAILFLRRSICKWYRHKRPWVQPAVIPVQQLQLTGEELDPTCSIATHQQTTRREHVRRGVHWLILHKQREIGGGELYLLVSGGESCDWIIVKLHQFQCLLCPTTCEWRQLLLAYHHSISRWTILYTCILCCTLLEWSPDHATAKTGSSQSQLLLTVWNEDWLVEHTHWLIEILQFHTCTCTLYVHAIIIQYTIDIPCQWFDWS